MPYKNSEKRKEKSRDAARSRRNNEATVFTDLTDCLPVPPAVLATLDKASVMRVAISSFKLRKLLGPDLSYEDDRPPLEKALDSSYIKSLNGILLVLGRDGDIAFLSDNCSQHLGLSQIELIGQSIFDFSNEGDKSTILGVLEKCAQKHVGEEFNFFMRVKCTLTSKGKNINLKSATYKVLHCTGCCVYVEPEKEEKGLSAIILVAEPIPHPSNIEILLDSNTLLTKHHMSMKMLFCDNKLCQLLGFQEEEMMNKSMFEFYHLADIQHLVASFKQMKELGQIKTSPYRLLAKHGGYIWVVTEATVIYNVRLEQAEHIVCVNYIVSGLEDEGMILADFQMPAGTLPVSMPEPQALLPPVPYLVEPQDIVDLTSCTKSLFTDDNTGATIIADDTCYDRMTPTADEVMVALHYNNQDPKLVRVESLFTTVDACSGEELIAPMKCEDDDDDSICMQTSMAPSDMVMVDLSEASCDTDMGETLILDKDDVDMSQRAPYISIDDDLYMPMEMDGTPIAVGANEMIGKTESVFNMRFEENEEEEGEEGTKKRKHQHIPFSVLRLQEAYSKKREEGQQAHQKLAALVPSAPTETNRLETGPPEVSQPTKRARLNSIHDGMRSPVVDDGLHGGSSVLLNLLTSGVDLHSDRYRLPTPKTRSPQPSTSSSSMSCSPSSSGSNSPFNNSPFSNSPFNDEPKGDLSLRALLTRPIPDIPSTTTCSSSSAPCSPRQYTRARSVTFNTPPPSASTSAASFSNSVSNGSGRTSTMGSPELVTFDASYMQIFNMNSGNNAI